MKYTTYFVQAPFKSGIEYVINSNGKAFVFELDYVDMNMKFKEIDRFLWESRKSQRYKNQYEGQVIINLTKWADKKPNDYLNAFLYLLEDYDYNCSFICEKEASEELKNALKEHFDYEIKNMLENQKNKSKRRIGFVIEEDCDVRE